MRRQAHKIRVEHRDTRQVPRRDRLGLSNNTRPGTPPTCSKLCASPTASAPKRSEHEKLTVRKRDQPNTLEKNDSLRGPAAVATVPAAPQSHSIHSPGSDTHGRKTRPSSACLTRHACLTSATARRSDRSEPSYPAARAIRINRRAVTSPCVCSTRSQINAANSSVTRERDSAGAS
ncbi:MAG: hypothetical protein H0V26_13810 [Solirubrobacterales bacterium]|nr:hypothetical protein [Solirubrobacterales bacterium]